MHRATVERLGPRTALRHRRHGMFHDLSWSEYRRLADRAATGLIDLGVQPGDRIAILSENRFEWLIADHAMLSAGAATVPLHAPLAPRQVEYQVAHSEARGIIVSNAAQAEKVWQVIASLPKLQFVISFEPIAAGPIPTLTWAGLIHRGRNVQAVARREAALTPQDLATIIYTSGTTGNPKGVMLTHSNLLTNAIVTLERTEMTEGDELLSWLPYSHIYARLADHYLTTLGGLTIALGGPVERLMEDLDRIRPTWLTSVPRFYEKVWSSVETLSPEERRRKLREIFPRIKQLSSGGAPLPRHIAEGFIEAGIALLEGYGLTESSPVISFNCRSAYRLGSVGRAVSGVEVRIADDGEILTRGPHVMKGYWRNDQATAETIDADGWLHTGDVGRIDEDGYLYITDRKKDLIITSGGKNIAPAELERLLVSDPCIDQAVVYGDRRPFVAALIVPNFAQLRKELGCDPAEDGAYIRDPQIVAFFEQRIASLMESVSQPERIKKFLILPRAFRLDADELTATLKVRRRHVISKYENDLAGLYA
jgi:long-chain acyl-CoA synthetase